MFNWLKNKTKRQPTWEDYNKYVESHTPQKPEEDPNAHAQNRDEIKFNENNPVYEERIERAKYNLMRNLPEEKKTDLLHNIYVDDAMEKEFKYINREDEI